MGYETKDIFVAPSYLFCSFKEVIVQELDGKFPEVIIPITMQQQMLHIPDVTPGDVHHIKLKPYSPYSIPGRNR